MKEFQTISAFKPYVSNLPTLKLTINTSKNKTFKITRLNKGTAPTDININWGDGSTTTYDNLLANSGNNHCSHTYKDNNIYNIIITGSVVESAYSVTFESNTNLISANGNIFIYYSGSLLTTIYLNSFFKDCINLTNISDNIFKLCTNIKNFYYTLYGCSLLQNIPNNLFKYNINVIDFQGCFYNCVSLQNIPNELFKYNTLVTNFRGIFSTCSSLKDLPEDLFKYNLLVTSFYYSFQYCSSLQNIPINLFDTNVELLNAEGIFESCTNITSIVPDLWNKTKWPKINRNPFCFRGCTKAANYASIPSGWK